MEFYTSEVERICEIKRNRLQVWLSNGWIIPSVQVASGHGTRNIFNEVDLVVISVFKHLVETGLSRKLVADLKEHVHKGLVQLLKRHKSNIDKMLKSEPEPHKVWLYYLLHMTELIPFTTAHLGEGNFYFLFFY